MSENINLKISKVKAKVAEKKVLETKLKNLNNLISKKESELKDLENILKEESDNVEKLKLLSLSNVISNIRRNKGLTIDKEEQKYLQDKIKYDKCKTSVNFLKEDREFLEARIAYLGDCEKEYTGLLQIKIHLLDVYGESDKKSNVLKMEKEIYTYLKNIKEIDESISIGDDLIKEVRHCKKILSSAKNWGVVDLIDSEFITSMLKHNKVDEAQRCFNNISNILYEFNKELKLSKIKSLKFLIPTMAFDIFFDNVFAKISINIRISEAYEYISNLEIKVDRVLNILREERENLYKIINNKKYEYDKYINDM